MESKKSMDFGLLGPMSSVVALKNLELDVGSHVEEALTAGPGRMPPSIQLQ